MSTASVWNVPREARNILKRFRKKEPSLTVELYPNHFRFQHQVCPLTFCNPARSGRQQLIRETWLVLSCRAASSSMTVP